MFSPSISELEKQEKWHDKPKKIKDLENKHFWSAASYLSGLFGIFYESIKTIIDDL